MSVRELVVLGTASQVPTRHRNHNGYLLRWDGQGILFDPGEGTQRQMLRAGVAAHDIDRICVTHFHGDHSLGLAGVIQRINLDQVPHPVTAHYPASGQHFFDRLRYATAYRETVRLTKTPVAGAGGVLAATDSYTLDSHKLSHPVESYGYRLTEPDDAFAKNSRLIELAGEVEGLDTPGFRTCVESGEHDSWVQKSDTAFREGGFQGTPTALLNGESIFPKKGDEQISVENLKKWVAEANKGKKPGTATPSAPAS